MKRKHRDRRTKRWIKRIAKGDHQAYNQLWDAFAHRVKIFLVAKLRNQADAEDVLQEVFLALWNVSAKQYRGGSPLSFLFGIAYRQAQRWKSRRQHAQSLDSDENSLCEVADGAEPMDERLIRDDLCRQIFSRLSADDTCLLNLFYFQELTSREIGEILGRPPGTVRRWLRDIRLKQ